LLEVNGRLGGHVPAALRRATGVDAVALALQAATGTASPPPDVGFGCVAFDYLFASPVEARRVVGVDGLDELQRLPGVERVQLRVPPGGPVDWRAGTEGSVCSISGAVATHDALRDTLAAADSVLRVTYSDA